MYVCLFPLGGCVLQKPFQLNVLISNDGGALLTNFTLSWLADSSPSFRDTGGTVNWMAPEIFDGGGPTAEGDVWAFGMTALVCPPQV